MVGAGHREYGDFSEAEMPRKRQLPTLDLSHKEKLIFGVTVALLVILMALGGRYYYVQYEHSNQHPLVSYSVRQMVDEEVPIDYMTVIPFVTLTAANSVCNATADFQLTFGWQYSDGSWIKAFSMAEWHLVKGFWVASAELPFQWFFNASGQFVKFKYKYRVGKQCWDERKSEYVQCALTSIVPMYAHFDRLGVNCSNGYAVDPVPASAALIQFHSFGRNVSQQLSGFRKCVYDDPPAFLLEHFPSAVIYPFVPLSAHNFLFRVKVHETTHINHTQTRKLATEIVQLPWTAGDDHSTMLDRHYFAVLADREVIVVTERMQLTAVAAVTAFATSATTILSLFGLLFTSQAKVPYHFTFGKRPEKYESHIVFGVKDEPASSDTSACEDA